MSKKFFNIIISLLLSLTIFSIFGDNTVVTAATDSSLLEDLTQSEYAKLAEALDITSTNTSIDMGNTYKIFDVNSESFQNAFLVSAYTTPGESDSVTGSSSSEIAQSYDSKFGINAYANAGTATPVGPVGFNVSYNFDKSAASSLSTINDEYYEYWEVTKTMKIAQIDWNSIDASTFFTDEFKNAINNISDINSAKAILNKYGTHVFDNYYFGGKLSVSRYIASSTNIAEEYSENNATFSLKADITTAITANAGNEAYVITNKDVNTNTTKTSTKVLAKGGNDLNGITPEELFTYKQEYASQYESGYVYSAWLKSIGKCESLRIVDVDKPVGIWDVLKKTSLYNEKVYDLLVQAYDIICFENYYENCSKLEMSPGYISSISYTTSDYNVEFSLNSNEINVPENSSMELTFGDLLLDTFNLSDIDLVVKSGKNICTLQDNVLTIKEGANGNTIKLALLVKEQEVFNLDINIGVGDFAMGYGTKDQPYLISNLMEWNQFINNSKYYNGYCFMLINDIDLNGKMYSVGGSAKKTPFYGVLDGNSHKIYNGTIIAKSDWNNMGLIGINNGVIKNLTLDNIKVLNSGINTASNNGNINAGILTGKNNGVISKVSIMNSSIRVVGKLDENSFLNCGSIAGLSAGECELSSVENNSLEGITYDGSGLVSIGGFVGKNVTAVIKNCYVADTSVNAYNYYNVFGQTGSYYCDLGSNKLYEKRTDGDWYEIGVVSNGQPSSSCNYYYDLSTSKLYKLNDKNWSEVTPTSPVLKGNKMPKNDVENNSEYALGGLVGNVDGESTIDFVALYENKFNQNNKKFGNVAGVSNNTSFFQNVYFEGVDSKAINSSVFDGCTNLRVLSLETIGNAEWNKYWTSNQEGHPILKWKAE